ncbi:hypothetical protein CDAR_204861 [Caerostris darwini]|uniref:Uncharacterized protein n=1 Tax=Caerostris darwini TaxID=1538125 RepID=A0AAV4PBW4_9ARAC|nr:hypothetical protein CDAR_204861 [Caerostris darwini]
MAGTASVDGTVPLINTDDPPLPSQMNVGDSCRNCNYSQRSRTVRDRHAPLDVPPFIPLNRLLFDRDRISLGQYPEPLHNQLRSLIRIKQLPSSHAGESLSLRIRLLASSNPFLPQTATDSPGVRKTPRAPLSVFGKRPFPSFLSSGVLGF